ncbi:hypothetical protein, partial [Streptomyces sp. IB201691-2A2]|uniref:hypothetical protein n=1 Tax=Streptomyces sp. IB201691-2A2 TaxID=2561920 RepID=UPI001CA7A2C1
MPLLRTGKVTNTTIAFRLPGVTGMVSVQLAIRATRAHRQQAEQLQDEAGLTPLWNGPAGGDAELAAWRGHVHSLSDSRALWSRALRRPALFRPAHPDWGTSAPTEDEV